MTVDDGSATTGVVPQTNGASRYQFYLSDCLVLILIVGLHAWVLMAYFSKYFQPGPHYVLASLGAVVCLTVYVLPTLNARRFSATGRAVCFLVAGIPLIALSLVFLGGLQSFFPMQRTNKSYWMGAGAAYIRAVADAQQIYSRTDYDKDGVLEYSPDIRRLWETRPNANDLCLIDRPTRDAELGLGAAGRSKAGFCFKILTEQGPNAPGGSKSYVDPQGNLTGGFGVLACPPVYEADSHHLCFIISSDGVIYQREFTAEELPQILQMKAFDPDTHWVRSE